MKKFLILSLVGSLLLIGGCSHLALKRGLEEMSATFNPILGETEESVILTIGVPISVEDYGKLKVYRYYKSFGQRSNDFLNAFGGSAQYQTTQTWEAYDTVDIVFKDGKAISWKGYVQR